MHVQSPNVDNYVDEQKVVIVDRNKYFIRCSMFDAEKNRSTDRWERRTDSEFEETFGEAEVTSKRIGRARRIRRPRNRMI